MTVDLVAFLNARYDEEEARHNEPGNLPEMRPARPGVQGQGLGRRSRGRRPDRGAGRPELPTRPDLRHRRGRSRGRFACGRADRGTRADPGAGPVQAAALVVPMSECTCALAGGEPHACRWAQMRGAAFLVGRPFQTVHSWQKRGLIASTRGPDGRIWVCLCETESRSRATYRRAGNDLVSVLVG